MSVPFGVPTGTLVTTPDGDRPIEDIAVGDTVLAVDPETGDATPATVTAAPTWEVTHVVDLVTPERRVEGVAPGLGVWDAFEGIFRASGSLSSLSEVAVWTGDGMVVEPLTDAPERAVPRTTLHHLAVEPPAGTICVGGIVVRAKAST